MTCGVPSLRRRWPPRRRRRCRSSWSTGSCCWGSWRRWAEGPKGRRGGGARAGGHESEETLLSQVRLGQGRLYIESWCYSNLNRELYYPTNVILIWTVGIILWGCAGFYQPAKHIPIPLLGLWTNPQEYALINQKTGMRWWDLFLGCFFHGSGGFYEGNMSMETDGNGDFFPSLDRVTSSHRQGELIYVRYVHQAAPWWCFIGQIVEVTNFIGGTRPGQRYKKIMENHHVFHGKINYKWPFSIAILTNYQRVQYPGFAMFDYQMVCCLTTPVSSWWKKKPTYCEQLT